MSNQPKIVVYPGGRLQVNGGTVQIGSTPTPPVVVPTAKQVCKQNGGNPCTPVGKLWLDANNANFTDYYVTSWANEVPNGETITFVNPRNTRLTHRGTLNGRQTVAFEGLVGQFNIATSLATAAPVASLTDGSCTMVMVFRRYLPTVNLDPTYLSATNLAPVLADTDGYMYSPTDTEMLKVQNDSMQLALLDHWCVVAIRMDATQNNHVDVWLDGVLQIAYDSYTWRPHSNSVWNIGMPYYGFFIGELAELIVWDQAMDPAIIHGTVVPGLRSKWNLDAWSKLPPTVDAQPATTLAGTLSNDLVAWPGSFLSRGTRGWLDAADETTLYRDADEASTSRPSPNGAIRRWRDKGTSRAGGGS